MAIPTAIQVEALDISNENFDADVAYENLRAHLQRYGTLVVAEADRDDLKQAIASIRDISTGLTHEFATLLTEAAFSSEVDVREFWGSTSTSSAASLRSEVITRESLDLNWGKSAALVLLDDVSFAVVSDPERRSTWLDTSRQVEEIAPLSRFTVSSTCREAAKHLQSRSLTTEADLHDFLDRPLELMLRGANHLVMSDRYLAANCLGDRRRIAALRELVEAVDRHAARHSALIDITLITKDHSNFGPQGTAKRLIGEITELPGRSLRCISALEVIASSSEGHIDHDRYLRAGRCGFFLGHGAETLALTPARGKSASYFSDLKSFRRLRKLERDLRKRANKAGDTVALHSIDPRSI
jgi:hypothetical protein